MELSSPPNQRNPSANPVAWEAVLLDSVAKRGSGHTPSKRRSEYWGGPIKWISLADSQALDRVFIDSTAATITSQGIANSSAVLHPAGTVVLSRDAGVGKSAIMKCEMAVSQHFMAWICGAELDNRYLYYWLQSKKPEFERIANGSTIKTIGLAYFRDLQIVKPPITEQRAIAAALSDVDALIAGLERLIAKKRDIKHASMQQLLTGQIRLPGFSGGWKVHPLGALGAIYGGLVGKSKVDFGHGSACYVPFVNVMANVRVDCCALEPVDVAPTETQNRVLLGDLLFNGSSETPEEVALCALMTRQVDDLYLNSFCFGFRLRQGAEASGLFLTYLMRSQMGRELMKSLAQGSTRYNLSKSALLQTKLELPGIDEQTAIASILSDMDADLSALESRLAKTRAIKQGLMQELLTGRTRLVDSAEQAPVQGPKPAEERKANVHFMRSVLAAEIVDQLHHEPTFGHVKFEKMMFLAEHLCQVETGSHYARKAAGPLDRQALHSIDSQLRKQAWFDVRKENGRYRYIPLEKRGGHRSYFDRYFAPIRTQLSEILDTFRSWETERCEIVATLYAAWNDLLQEKGSVSDDLIVHEVLNNWHESKQRIPEERWLKALGWMREKGYVPGLVAEPIAR